MGAADPLPPAKSPSLNCPQRCEPETRESDRRLRCSYPPLQSSSRQWQKLLPKPDIANCIALSKLRCIVTIVSLVLLMTDIPRTGLGIRNLQMYYPVLLMPSTAVRFGPFNYPVLHISRLPNSSSSSSPASSSAEFAGLKGDQPIPAARAWSYQYDTTSVGLRGAVELLNVTEFPDVLLYKPSQDQPATNPDSLLDLRTAFTMLDAFISAAQSELRPAHKKIPTTMRFATKHNWVDRVHHYVVRFASKNPAWRLHSLHVPLITPDTQSLAICSNAGVAKQTSPRPRFCNHPGIWKCKHPLDASLPAVRLWDHMDLRFRAFKQRYPDLELDVALVSSQRLSSTSGAMRSTFYNYEALEVVVLTRGRRCADNVDNGNVSASSFDGTKTCTTVFVDDYRYERDIVQTNLVDWYGIISMLRGSAQAYVWIRAALLIYGAYVVAGQSVGEKVRLCSRLTATVLIVLKIPFQVIVYSSSLPVAGYVLALVLDSSFTDIFLDSYWASVGGAVNFELVSFLKTTAIQMRGVWLLALFASLTLFAMGRSRCYDDGFPGIHGLLISFTSSLTVFGPYKDVRYRDMNITLLFRITNGGQIMDIVQSANSDGCFNSSSYFYGGSSKTVRLCIVAVVLGALIIKTLGYLTPRASLAYRTTRGMIIKVSQIAPCGMEHLWISTLPIIHFSVPIRLESPYTLTKFKHKSFVFKAPRVAPSSLPNLTALSKTGALEDSRWFCATRRARPTTRDKTPPKEGVCPRTTVSHSILQLMNIAMMTDPCNFLWLRLLGVKLYLYKVRFNVPSMADDSSTNIQPPYTVILPYAEDELVDRTGLSSEDVELLDCASSQDIPISVLLQCG